MVISRGKKKKKKKNLHQIIIHHHTQHKVKGVVRKYMYTAHGSDVKTE